MVISYYLRSRTRKNKVNRIYYAYFLFNALSSEYELIKNLQILEEATRFATIRRRLNNVGGKRTICRLLEIYQIMWRLKHLWPKIFITPIVICRFLKCGKYLMGIK